MSYSVGFLRKNLIRIVFLHAMKAVIISIGDELLIGQTVDTNSSWMGKELSKIGVAVVRKWAISDAEEDILSSLKEAEQRADLVLITGGLGPTKDDITKHCLCKYFNTKLVRNKGVEDRVTAFFTKLNRPILEVNRMQADLPESCTVLPNPKGTASGMWFEQNDTIFVSMPGVPYEMKAIMQGEVFPRLLENPKRKPILHKTILTQGMGESFLAETIKDWENSLASVDIKLAYLPSPGIVKLRLSAYSGSAESQEERIKTKVEELYQLIPELIYAEDDVALEEVVHQSLIQKKLTLAIAESCTGGYLAHQFTKQAGSSNYFINGVIAYSVPIKQKVLGVSSAVIDKFGVVSEVVAEEMAKGAQQLSGTNVAIATTGIAGPDGGTAENPVGTICWSVIVGDKVYSTKERYGSDRQRNIERVCKSILNYLRKEL